MHESQMHQEIILVQMRKKLKKRITKNIIFDGRMPLTIISDTGNVLEGMYQFH